jgi:RNA polymerase sigma-70 factor (ECF subfamily)
MEGDANKTTALLRRVSQGDRQALDELFARHRERLRRMVDLRLDARLHGRIDAADVVQEAHLDAWKRLGEYLQDPRMPFFLWLRFLTGQKVLEFHRRHLGAQRRDVRHEVRLDRGPLPEAESAALAQRLLDTHTAPLEAAIRAEMKMRLQEALNSLDPIDREVLALRHFEHLTNAETAKELAIKEGAASQRYVRALRKLEGILASMPGGREGMPS